LVDQPTSNKLLKKQLNDWHGLRSTTPKLKVKTFYHIKLFVCLQTKLFGGRDPRDKSIYLNVCNN